MPKRSREEKVSEGKANTVQEFTHGDLQLQVGGSIQVQGDNADEPFVGKIKAIKPNKKGDAAQIKVAWYYRPEECQAGRRAVDEQVFHGEKELFASNHTDWIESATIRDTCVVHTIEGYKKLQESTDSDFYTRFSYDPQKNEFQPKKVAVYCTCEFPYNPDVFMISCGECEEWYHPRCIGLSDGDVAKYEKGKFVCHKCSKSD